VKSSSVAQSAGLAYFSVGIDNKHYFTKLKKWSNEIAKNGGKTRLKPG